MAEFLLNRRYCRFNKRKSKMDGDDAVNFKMGRFILDVDKYLEKSKKRKARKQAKNTEKNLPSVVNKGIYKNTVLSHPGVKAILSGSTTARLKGDLVALSSKNKHEKNAEIKYPDVNNRREIPDDKNNLEQNPPGSILLSYVDSLSIGEHHDAEDEVLGDLNCLPVEKNTEEIIPIAPIDGSNSPSVRENQGLEEKTGNRGLSSQIENGCDEFQHSNIQQENCNQIFNMEPSKEIGEFFDILNATPERKIESSYQTFNKHLIHSPKWDDFSKNDGQQKYRTSTPNIKEPQVSRLPDNYSFTFSPLKKNLLEHDLFKEKEEKNLEAFNLTPTMFNNKKQSTCLFNQTCEAPFFLSNDKFPSPKVSDNSNIFNLKRFSSNILRFRNDLCTLSKKKYSNVGIDDGIRTSADVISKLTKKHLELNSNYETNYMKANMKKHLHKNRAKDQLHKKRIGCKDELLASHKQLITYSNKRFKNNLKFSPHKYC